jgi:hypothetical protein
VPLVLLAPLVVLAVVAAMTAWLAARVARSSTTLQQEVASLGQLRAARDRLVSDLERTRRTFDTGRRDGTEAWPPGRGR